MLEAAFWTHDYSSGVRVLFEELRKGCAENAFLLNTIQQRIKVERAYASDLVPLGESRPPRRPESVLSKAIVTLGEQTTAKAHLHIRIAAELDQQLRQPLHHWGSMHVHHVSSTEDRLQKLIAGYERLLFEVNKQRPKTVDRRKVNLEPVVSTIRTLRDRFSEPPSPHGHSMILAGLEYTEEDLKILIKNILMDSHRREYRVPLLGVYPNVCAGASIATACRRHLRNDSIAYSEKFGQALVDLKFLRPIGQIMNRFVTSQTSNYQWTPYVYEFLKIDSDDDHQDNFDKETNLAEEEEPVSPSPLESDEYLQKIFELDVYRCEMEHEIMSAFQEMETIERQRVVFLKQLIQKFIQITSKLNDMHALLENAESVTNTLNDEDEINRIVQTHQTGPFVPQVTTFDGSDICQTFGVDLAHSSFFVGLLLSYLYAHPVAIEAWTTPQSLSDVYKARSQVNSGRPFKPAVLDFFAPDVVAGLLKQYLLELPDSILPLAVYDSVKDLYDEHLPDLDEIARVMVAVPRLNRHVLQELCTFWAEYDQPEEISKCLAVALLRPRAWTALNIPDTHPRRLIADLIKNHSQIFPMIDEMSNNTSTLPDIKRISRAPKETVNTYLPSPTDSDPLHGSNMLPLTLTPDRDGRRIVSQPAERGKGMVLPLGRPRSGSDIKQKVEDRSSPASSSMF